MEGKKTASLTGQSERLAAEYATTCTMLLHSATVARRGHYTRKIRGICASAFQLGLPIWAFSYCQCRPEEEYDGVNIA